MGSEPPRRGRRSLKVAMTFPTKKQGVKRPASEPLPQPKAQDSEEEEEEENFMDKRALNIKENKEMVQFAVFLFFQFNLWTLVRIAEISFLLHLFIHSYIHMYL